MLVAAVYEPEQWRDFFVMVGGAAAVLSGLVFVALSLNLGVILRDAVHRSRSIGTLANFTGIFMVCALALMGGQNHAAIGTEWLVVSIGAVFVFVYPWPRARREGPPRSCSYDSSPRSRYTSHKSSVQRCSSLAQRPAYTSPLVR
jgi:hypothetical protein